MFIFIVVLSLTFCNAIICGYEYDKCCDIGSYLVSNDTQYECVNNTQYPRRLQYVTERYGYLAQNKSKGLCVDGDKNFEIYSVQNNNLIRYDSIRDYFHKCCPFQYLYDPVKHSCVPSQNSSTDFINPNIIKVGLPDCDLIVDHLVNSSEDYVIKDTYIHLRKENKRYFKGTYCIDETISQEYVVRVCIKDDNICKFRRCIHKCCPDGQSFVNGKVCLDTYTHGLDLTFNPKIDNPTDPFAIIHNFRCEKMYIMNPKRYNFSIDDRGNFIYFFNLTNSFKSESYARTGYCIEHVHTKTKDNHEVFMCFAETQENPKYTTTMWAKITSCIFLALTIFLYILLNEVRNNFGKVLINYCLSLMLTFIFLSYLHYELHSGDIGDGACTILGFLTIYLTTSGFTWLNVMCFDIWYTFGSPKSMMERSQQRRDLKRFLCYLLYGWGVPFLLICIIMIFHQIRILPYEVQPFIGQFKCFLENSRTGNFGSIIFKDIPYLILEIINTTLFFKTIFYCLKVKNEINKMNDTHASVKRRRTKAFNADKERLFLIMKLSIITGFLFLFEVISAFYDFSAYRTTAIIEIIWDTVNCLQGVFIFIIFICKRKIWMELKKKLNIPVTIRKISVNSTKTTEITDVNATPILSRKECV